MRRKWFPVAYWMGLLGVFVAGAQLAKLRPGWVDALDHAILAAFAAARSPILDAAAPVVTVLGTFPGYAPTAGIIIAWSSLRSRAEGLFAAVGIGGAALYYFPLNRWLFTRPRPLWFGDPSGYEGHSFPSGHALVSLGLALVVIASVKRTARPKLGATVVVAALYALVVAATRLYLQVHHPSDVLAGWLLAAAWVSGVSLWHHRMARSAPPVARE